MPDNHIPSAKPEDGTGPAEFNFDNPATENPPMGNPQMGNPRMKRRSLKAKPAGLIKPSGAAISAARELEREAPPLSAGQSQAAQPKSQESAPVKSAPPRTTPAPKPPTTSSLTSTPTTSPHGIRPATLYYSSYPRKDKDAASSPMKTTPTSGQPSASASSPSAASTTTPLRTTAATASASTVRPSSTTSPRPAASIDYRANVERQTREQKSVGSILSYVVYGLIAIFVIGASLAGYGADIIFAKLHDQSATVSELDQRYAAENKILTTNLATAQEAIVQAQAQITRQQDLIVKQQEELNRLIAATNDNAASLKTERQLRAQETATLRQRVKDLENRNAPIH